MGDKTHINEVHNLKSLKRMIDVMSLLKESSHSQKNIAQMRKVQHSVSHIIIVMQFGGEDNLFRRLLQRQATGKKQKPLPLFKMQSMFYQMLVVVKYLHSKRIAHRDLKPENFIINETADWLELKLADFDLAVVQAERAMCRSACGTVPFTAPEALMDRPYDGLIADCFSLGVVLFESFCGVHSVEKAIGLSVKKQAGQQDENRPDDSVCTKMIRAFGSPGTVGRMLRERHRDDVKELLPALEPVIDGLMTIDPQARWTSEMAGSGADLTMQ
eukprot:NODE_2183_length_979_cov_353.314935.p1 GENE.NODE_2183_length_979_cov_353.314935~~NODE_2183_length_979_cov_353.314935.p1  ORF type:complete len:272 (+),score=117.22 NODE_2183_length_979_cov_353.314935:3-818(+)